MNTKKNVRIICSVTIHRPILHYHSTIKMPNNIDITITYEYAHQLNVKQNEVRVL